jgi:hypothetical protein
MSNLHLILFKKTKQKQEHYRLEKPKKKSIRTGPQKLNVFEVGYTYMYHQNNWVKLRRLEFAPTITRKYVQG